MAHHVAGADEERWNTLAVIGGREGGVVDSTPAPEKREKGKVQSVTDAKFPVYCSKRGSAGPSEKAATPVMECEVELLEGRRISSELKTKRTKTEEEKERGRPAQGTKHWPGERDDSREQRKST